VSDFSIFDVVINIDMKDALSGFSDFLVAIIGVVALYLANRGMKYYLISERVKHETQKIQQANQKISGFCAEILASIISHDQPAQKITDDSLNAIKSSVKNLYAESKGTSSEIQSKLFLLMRVITNLESSYKFDRSIKILVDRDILNFVLEVCESVIDDAQRLIDVPVSKKLSDSDLHPRLQKLGVFRKRQNRKFDYNFGLNLSPKSEDVFLLYWKLMNNTGIGNIGTKVLCKTIGNNLPAAMSLLFYKVYVPPVFLSKDSDLNNHRFGMLHALSGEQAPLFLISITQKESLSMSLDFKNRKLKKQWVFTYANLDNSVQTNTKKWLGELKKNGIDPVSGSTKYNDLLTNVKQEADGSVTIKIEDSKVKKLDWTSLLLKEKLNVWIRKQD